MEKEKALDYFRKTGVMLEGHFLLTSGRHSNRYMQCAHLFEDTAVSELFSKDLAEQFAEEGVTMVVGPAVGGILLAYEVARQMGVKNIFAERENGAMTFRRGFAVPEGARVLVVEDVVTTGGSVREVIELVRQAGATVVGVGSVVDRSNGKVDFGVKYRACLSMEVVSWEADACPLCAQGTPAVKPGSRSLK